MLNLQSDVTISSTILIFYLTEGRGKEEKNNLVYKQLSFFEHMLKMLTRQILMRMSMLVLF